MSSDSVFVEQTKAKIHDWKHELIELEARVAQNRDAPDQLQVNKQRIAELKSQIDTAQQQIDKSAAT